MDSSVSQMEAPTVSVVLPVYNAAKYLAQCMDSLLAQTFTDFEILAFDDGSTDGSIEILKEFATHDSRVNFLLKDHCGYTPHLNEGIQIARGEFIARMDSDDICFPERFERQVEFLNQHPNVVVVGSSVELMDEYGDSFARMIGPSSHSEIDARHLNGGGGTVPHPSVMMRRAAVLKVGSYQARFEPAEDLDLWLRLAEIGELTNLKEPLLRYRIHAGMVSQSKAAQQQNQVKLILREAYQRRQIPVSVTSDKTNQGTAHEVVSDPLLTRMQKALENGFPRTAVRYAVRRLKANPVSPNRWRDLLRTGYAALKAKQ